MPAPVPHQPGARNEERRGRFARQPGMQVLLVAAPVALLLFLTGAALAVQNYERSRERTIATTAALAGTAADDADRFLTDRLTTLMALATAPPMRSGDAATMQAYVDQLSPENLGFSGSIGWIDRAGQLRVLSTLPPNSPPVDVSDRDYVRAVLATNRAFIGQATIGRVQPTPIVPLAVPTRDSAGVPNGILLGSIRPDRLEASSRGLRFAGNVTIVDRAGQTIIDGGVVPALAGVANTELLARFRREGHGALAGVPALDNEPDRLIGFATAPSGDWIVAIDQSMGEALAPARRALASELAVLLVVSLVSVTGAGLAGRRLTRLAAARRAAEEHYRTLAEVAPVGIFYANPAGEFTYLNEYWCTLVGAPAAQQIGRRWSDVLHPEDSPRLGRAWEEAAREGRTLQLECRLLPPGGRTLWVLAQVTVERERDGALRGYVGTITDITGHKETEGRERVLMEVSTALASTLDVDEALERLAHLVVPRQADWCIISTLEADGTIQRRALAHADPAQEAALRQVPQRYPFDAAQPWDTMKVLDRGEPLLPSLLQSDAWLAQIRPDDLPTFTTVGMASVMLVPLRARGRMLGALRLVRTTPERPYGDVDLALAVQIADRAAVAIDNARLFAAEHAARARAEAAQRRLTLLAEAGVTLAGSLDNTVTLTALAELLIPTLADWCTVNVLEEGQVRALVARHRDPARQGALEVLIERYPASATGPGAFATVLRTGRGCIVTPTREEVGAGAPDEDYLELIHTLGFGTTIIVPLRAHDTLLGALRLVRGEDQPPYDADDLALAEELARRTALAIDNARLYQEAQAAIAARDHFLSVAAHELRTPVTGVRAYAQLIRLQQEQGQSNPATIAKAIAAIERGTSRLTLLIQDLLDVAQLQAGQLRIRREPVELVGLIEEVVAQARLTLGAGQQLTADLPPGPCFVSGDAARLEQVLSNLLDNARKYSPEGGPIALTLGEAAGGVQVTVRDEGIGLAPGEAKAIFTPFNRSQAALTRQIPGLGLGLSIAQAIVAQHHGRLWATSEGEGRGTTLALWLPLATPADPGMAAATAKV